MVHFPPEKLRSCYLPPIMEADHRRVLEDYGAPFGDTPLFTSMMIVAERVTYDSSKYCFTWTSTMLLPDCETMTAADCWKKGSAHIPSSHSFTPSFFPKTGSVFPVFPKVF